MAESATLRPAAVVALAATPTPAPGVYALTADTALRVLPPRTLVRLQFSRAAIATVGEVRIGATALPATPGRCTGEDPAVLWLAPDGWMLLSTAHDGPSLVELARRAFGERTAAAVEVSDALVSFELAGPRTRELLARGTGLELSAESLAPGRCTRTRLTQLAVILRPFGAERVELIVDRGAATWLREWFIDAGSLL